MQVGVVGAGAMGATHVRAWQSLGVEVAVHARHDPSRFAARHGIRPVADLAELVEASNVVDVCTPTPSHEDLVLAAVRAGRHVVCEKPLARTAAVAQRLADAAASADVVLFPAHVVRYFPAYADLRQRLLAGEVGVVRTARLTRQVAAPAPGSWFRDRVASGGVVLDLMVHDLDQALWLLGPVVEVHAEALDGVGDRVRATLHHTAGATSTVEAWWGPAGTPFATGFAVHGKAGSVEHDSRSATLAWADPLDPYVAQLADVLEHLRTGRPTRVGADDGVAAVALADRVLSALGPGRP